MAKWKRTRDEDKSAIIKSKLLDPQKSLRDIERETGINRETVSDIIDSIPELLTSSDYGKKIIEDMDEIVSDIATITRLSVKPIVAKVNDWTLSINDIKSLNEIARNNFDRSQLLKGKATANVKVSGFKEYSTEELLKQLEE